MSKIFYIFVFVIVLGISIGNDSIRELFKSVWTIFWVLFFVFLIAYGWMEHRNRRKFDKEMKKEG